MSTRDLLAEAQGYAAAYLEAVANRHVGGTVDRRTLIDRLGGPLPEASSDPHVVLANLVRQRVSEIGVRMAFGAPPSSIFRLVIGQGLWLSGIGVVAGVAGALLLTRAMTKLLVNVAPTDPVTYASMIVLFFVIAAFACWIPARRAALVDPNVALREV